VGDDGSRTIEVVGEGTASAQPDRCVLHVALRATRDRVGDAIGAVAATADDTLRALREAGLGDSDLATTDLNVQPWWDQPSQQITAHVATYALSVSVAGIDRVPAIVDALSAAAGDALQIERVGFAHGDPAPLVAAARRAAVADARARAEQLADAAGVGLGALLEVREGIGATPGMPRAFMRAARVSLAAAMPVEPGDQAVHVRVELTFAIDARDV
jgi:uncharacterized protein